jgi:hypothetical protein
MDKYLSVITNFGCHYTCPYCIVKNNHLNIPKTTVDGLKGEVSSVNVLRQMVMPRMAATGFRFLVAVIRYGNSKSTLYGGGSSGRNYKPVQRPSFTQAFSHIWMAALLMRCGMVDLTESYTTPIPLTT